MSAVCHVFLGILMFYGHLTTAWQGKWSRDFWSGRLWLELLERTSHTPPHPHSFLFPVVSDVNLLLFNKIWHCGQTQMCSSMFLAWGAHDRVQGLGPSSDGGLLAGRTPLTLLGLQALTFHSFLCVCVFIAGMPMHHMYDCYQKRPEKCVRSPGTEVADDCSHHMGAGNKPGSL